jgi:hypothetical protein
MFGKCGCEGKVHGHHARHASHGASHMDMASVGCGCSCSGRRFLSKNERIEALQEYKEALKNELEGVEEELTKLRVE